MSHHQVEAIRPLDKYWGVAFIDMVALCDSHELLRVRCDAQRAEIAELRAENDDLRAWAANPPHVEDSL